MHHLHVIIVNFGPEDESIAYQVLFTNGATAMSACEGPAPHGPDKGIQGIRGTAQA